MTLTEQVKILDDKNKANKAQYDLDREAGKISALSSSEFFILFPNQSSNSNSDMTSVSIISLVCL